MANKIEDVFYSLGRTKKSEFISANIEYASAQSIASYVQEYLFDVLSDVGDDEYVANYLREKGYDVHKKN